MRICIALSVDVARNCFGKVDAGDGIRQSATLIGKVPLPPTERRDKSANTPAVNRDGDHVRLTAKQCDSVDDEEGEIVSPKSNCEKVARCLSEPKEIRNDADEEMDRSSGGHSATNNECKQTDVLTLGYTVGSPLLCDHGKPQSGDFRDQEQSERLL